VGIVVDVNADGTFTFIHASTSKGVRVSESTESYYVNRYVGARRVM
jgi:type IV secretory pathway component VirB8